MSCIFYVQKLLIGIAAKAFLIFLQISQNCKSIIKTSTNLIIKFILHFYLFMLYFIYLNTKRKQKYTIL